VYQAPECQPLGHEFGLHLRRLLDDLFHRHLDPEDVVDADLDPDFAARPDCRPTSPLNPDYGIAAGR
jgi:hypothetical protein